MNGGRAPKLELWTQISCAHNRNKSNNKTEILPQGMKLFEF